MRNLAGDKDCDSIIEIELTKAGIELVRHDVPLRREVPASITGKLGSFEFVRAETH